MNIHIAAFFSAVVFVLSSGQKLEGEVLPNQGICDSKDIRNSPRELLRLRNCSVIVGYLQIVLIEGVPKDGFANYSFPELREVTHFVLLYRVEGLTSLGQLFPNLSLIRGRELVVNFAFIIYELPQLQEIGLRSLTTIQRGAVHVEKNTQLCYAETLDWELITNRTVGHYFGHNGPAMCPGIDTCRGCDHGCWNSRYCLRTHSDKCHPECLAGCTSITGLCYRCKNFINGDTCVASCPPDKVEYSAAFQCITEQMCKKMFRGRGWTWEGKCVRRCPKGYDEKMVTVPGPNSTGSVTTKTCVSCGSCPVYCAGSEIGSLADAQYYKGCNIVLGSLQIRLQGEHSDDVMKEMEDSLGGIEEIHGHLKVYRSLPLTSLNFFKNLTLIRGDDLEFTRYSFIVFEMNNLQSLWDWKTKKNLTISNGTIFLHYNAKLCAREIQGLLNITKHNVTSYDVSLESNGYKMICDMANLKTDSIVLGKNNVSLIWDRTPVNKTGPRNIGYLLFYLEEEDESITPDFGRDSCYENEWKSIFITEPKDPYPKRITYNITDLKPFTKYAFYVESFSNVKGNMTGMSAKNGQGNLKFFRTETDIPSMPIDVTTSSFSEDTISIFWSLDPDYKGIITRYMIEMYIQLDDVSFLDNRNYCTNPLVFYPTVEKNSTDEDSNSTEGCKCGEIENRTFWEQIIAKDANENVEIFNTAGHSMLCKNITEPSEKVYDILNEIKCGKVGYSYIEVEANETHDGQRAARHVDFKVPKGFPDDPTPRPVLKNLTLNNQYHFFSAEFGTATNNYTLYNLKHHTKYVIFIAACNGNRDTDCGPISITSQRTAKNENADNISEITSFVLNNSAVYLFWEEPKQPNGAIVSFTLEYIKTDTENFKPVHECVTRLDHEKNSGKYFLHHLHPGSYAVRVRATSLAGDGEYTDSHYFVVPVTNFGFNWSLFISLGVTSVIGIFLYAYYYHRRHQTCRNDERALIGNEYVAKFSVDDPFTENEADAERERVDILEIT